MLALCIRIEVFYKEMMSMNYLGVVKLKDAARLKLKKYTKFGQQVHAGHSQTKKVNSAMHLKLR